MTLLGVLASFAEFFCRLVGLTARAFCDYRCRFRHALAVSPNKSFANPSIALKVGTERSRSAKKILMLTPQERLAYLCFLASILLSTLLLINPKLLFAQAVGPDQETSEPLYALCLHEKVNIRAGQGVNFEVLGKLNKNDEVVIIGEKYDWYKIKLPPTAICFVHKDYIEGGITKAENLRVRARSKPTSNILGILKRGQRVKALAEEGDWLKIVPPDNCAGWIKKDYLKLSQRPLKDNSSLVASLPPRNDIPSPAKQVKAYGKIDDLGKIVNRQGTHKLIQGRKVLYYLKSEEINLNHYLYDKVCVIGKLLDLENSAFPVIDVEQIKLGQ